MDGLPEALELPFLQLIPSTWHLRQHQSGRVELHPTGRGRDFFANAGKRNESQSRQFRLFSNIRSYLRVGFLSLCHQQSLFCRISMDFQGLRSGFCFSCSSRFMLYRSHEHCFVRGQLLLVILPPEPRRILCIWLAVLMHCQQLFTYWL